MAAEAVQAVRKCNWPLVALLVVSVMRKLSECVTRPMNRALSRPTKWCMRITIYTCFLACGGTWKDACIYKFIYIYMHLIIIIRHITTNGNVSYQEAKE